MFRPHNNVGAKLTPARLRKLLAKHHIRRWSAEQIAEVLAAPPLLLAPGSAEATTEHVLLLMPQLRLLSMQRKQVADRIQQLLDEMAKCDVQQSESQTLSDVPVLLSLPGVGRVITAMMLAEAAALLAERAYYAIMAARSRNSADRQNLP